MRTTVDIPDDLHAILRSVARDRGTSLSQTVTDLVRERLHGGRERDVPRYVGRDEETGLPVVRLGQVVTGDDVRALEDEW